MRSVARAGGVCAALALGLALVPALSAQADPSRPSDAIACDVEALKDAIDAANAAGGGTIRLPSKCTYTLTAVDNTGPSGDPNGLPLITTPITLKGGKRTVIERSAAAPQFRIFEITGPAGALTLDGTGRGKGRGDGWSAASVLGNPVLSGIDRDRDRDRDRDDRDCRSGSGLTVRGGSSTDDGGAVFVDDNRSLTLKCTTLTGNHADDDGGAVYAEDDSTVTATSSHVDGNTAADEGGGIFTDEAALSLTHSSADRNAAGDGGGIFTALGSLSLTDSTVNKNTASDGGGGGVLSVETPATYIRSQVNRNTGGALGGGIVIITSGDLTTFSRSEISGNTAGEVGGGLFIIGGNTTMESTGVSKNTVTGSSALGGGIFLLDGTLTLRDSRVTGNTAPGAGSDGGGITNSGTLDVESTVIKNNTTADRGGGLYNDGGAATLTDSRVTRNKAASGGGIFEEPGSTVTLNQTAVVNNDPDNCAPPGAVPGCIG
ncbi:right-handed parallel beta-helix repeat-containing protein [Streptomyces tirandamycinicus]|uniref:Right handed beta helix domain-containing protein n=1 Tax=Streptomyces tirandamycinicus TaxID=2174846 RepID=A0A2S1SUG6_9ACTN|nr:right-handed parallel beta-helix repeat-containing protein [Streptomyces tirandamycinicus]AWI30040.1 hypothetical protein DDW44_15615 [Streptomyces tirandamycinicus]